MSKCKLCNKKFKVISSTHLLSAHKVSCKDYIKKFGHKGVGFSINVLNLSKTDNRYINWRKSLENRDTAWAKGYTKETHPSIAKMAETFRRKKIDNFAQWREEARKKGLIPQVYKPLNKNRDLAFLVGLTLGDGNINKFPRTECLRIALAAKYPGLINYTDQIIKKVFNKVPNVRKVKSSACYTVTIYQNKISDRLGIPAGDRHNFKFNMPDWIQKNKDFLLNFIRGLFEAEGSLSIHLPTCTYNFQFSNKNKSLLKNVEKSLQLLGYHPEVRLNSIRLRKKAEVESFRQLIRFRMF